MGVSGRITAVSLRNEKSREQQIFMATDSCHQMSGQSWQARGQFVAQTRDAQGENPDALAC